MDLGWSQKEFELFRRMVVILPICCLAMLMALLVASMILARRTLDQLPSEKVERIEINQPIATYPLWQGTLPYRNSRMRDMPVHRALQKYYYLHDKWNEMAASVIIQIEKEQLKYGIPCFFLKYYYDKLPYIVTPLTKKPQLVIVRRSAMNPNFFWPFGSKDDHVIYYITKVYLEIPTEPKKEIAYRCGCGHCPTR